MQPLVWGVALGGALIALVSAVALIFCLKPLARYLGLLDRPQGHKQHQGEIPLVGGLAIFIGYSLALVAMGQASLWFVAEFWVWLALLGLGLWDDIRRVKVGVRVLVQVLAIILLCAHSGVQLDHLGHLFGDQPVLLGHFALPVTILGLIGIKNGINLLDGLDGLAATQVLAILFWFCVLSLQSGIAMLLLLCAPLAGAVLGFLVFNLRLPGRPARVFLGDHGSVFLGFTLGWFAVLGSQRSIPAFTPIEAVWVLGLPVLDTNRVMISRIARGTSPFLPARDHLHHLLLDSGWSVNAVVMLLLLVTLALGGVVWIARWLHLGEPLLFAAFLVFSLVFLLGAQYLDSKLRRDGRLAA